MTYLPDDDREDHGLVVEAEDLGQTAVDLGRLLHLVADVDLAELLEEAQQRHLQLTWCCSVWRRGGLMFVK